jgi:hypothetical protein
MSTTKSERTLDYVRISGPGVDALDRRKEYNNNEKVDAESLSASINKVKDSIFKGLKMLSGGALKRLP